MATGIVRSALCCVLTESDPMQDSCGERIKESREQICRFLQALNEDQALEIFDKFSSSLLSVLEKCVSTCLSSARPCRSKSVQREKLWSAFHNVSVGELPKLWSELFSSGHIPKLSPLVYQNVHQRLYEDLIKSHVCSQSTGTCSSPTEVPPLTADEENIIRYAAGYVAFKMVRKYESGSIPEYVECLSMMAVAGDDSSLLDYTCKWTRQVNRGGLFEVSDMCYSLFREIELKTRQHLPSILSQATSSDLDCNKKEIIISAVLGNDFFGLCSLLTSPMRKMP